MRLLGAGRAPLYARPNTLNQVVEKKKNAEKNKDGEERPAGAEDEEDEEDEDAFGCLEDTLKEVENVSQPVVGTAAMKDVRPFTLASASRLPQQGTLKRPRRDLEQDEP